jgi:hypothetical protein
MELACGAGSIASAKLGEKEMSNRYDGLFAVSLNSLDSLKFELNIPRNESCRLLGRCGGNGLWAYR